MAKHRLARRRPWWLSKTPTAPIVAAPTETQPLSTSPDDDDDYDEDDDEAAAAELNEELDEYFDQPPAKVLDLAEHRVVPDRGGADIVMMARPATGRGVQAVYPDGRVEDVPCELRVVATIGEIQDGMLLNIMGGGRTAAIAVTQSP